MLHGCRKSVFWKVRLTPQTDKIPVVNLYFTICDKDKYHLGLRQVVMALKFWAIDVPQKLLQSEAKLYS